ncbi:hypothetical protein XENOCAPTIV_009488 [Xenoophorus captivus]|uniref:G-protein coupled receptors family 1 profile domain-containing protein n=1 Tax=Xenoophorus captivus TaxID=1517983 RepID=A0ABV0Q9R0_9TELE
MSQNVSSLALPSSSIPPTPVNISQYPSLTNWEPPSFTRAAQFRVGATFFLFVFAACSNLALLTSVWCGRGRRLSSHLRPLMLSLASADLMMTFVVMPLDAVWNITVQWYGGDALCKLLCFLKLFAMHASAFILVVISLDRHHAILHPLDALSAHRRNRCMLLLAWSLSLLLASPQVRVCTGVNRTGTFLHSGTDIIPKARMKTLKMTVVIVLSFIVCWTPYYLLGIWYWFQPDMLRVTPEYIHHALFVFGNLNTCCDPVIYGFYTPSFRADLAAFCHQTKSDQSPKSLDRLSGRQGPHSGEEDQQPSSAHQALSDGSTRGKKNTI